MADQVNNLVAENRQGLRDFSETGLYEITGLAQDAQRMVNQINRVAEQLERDPSRFLFGDRNQGGVRAE
jgi:phospholipid/cholesterol/gamma-HCH transport system substrate-binding protein